MRIGLLTTTQYPADTVIWIISMLLREAAGFVGILAIASVMGSLGAWSFYEICLLFSMCAVIEAISMAFFDNVWSIDSMIRRGEMDVYLVRPASPFVQMVGNRMHFQAVLSMLVYIGIFLWSARGAHVPLNLHTAFVLVEYVICGTLINSGIYTLFNSLNFWIVQGSDLAEFVQTCREFVKYPLHVFPAFIHVHSSAGIYRLLPGAVSPREDGHAGGDPASSRCGIRGGSSEHCMETWVKRLQQHRNIRSEQT